MTNFAVFVARNSRSLKKSKEKLPKQKKKIDLISVFTHNVKGPIKFIQHVTDHTIEHWDEMTREDLYDSAKVINVTTRELSQLLVNMLQWQQLKEHSIKRAKGRFNLWQLIEEEMLLQRSVSFLKKIQIVNKVPKRLIVDSDQFLIRLILQNILSNALKFSFINSKILIKAKYNDGKLALSVEDEGKGMTEEELEMVLSDDLYTTIGTFEESGTGFGTSIVKDLTDLLDGTLEIKSKLDAGTKVTLIIPA